MILEKQRKILILILIVYNVQYEFCGPFFSFVFVLFTRHLKPPNTHTHTHNDMENEASSILETILGIVKIEAF